MKKKKYKKIEVSDKACPKCHSGRHKVIREKTNSLSTGVSEDE